MKQDRATRTDDLDEEESSFDLGKLFRTLRRRWWILPASLLLTVGFGIFYIWITPKTYRSVEIVQVEQAETKVLNITDLRAEDLKQDQVLKTIEQNLLSGEVLNRVIQQLKLTPPDLGLKKRETPYLPQELVEVLSNQVSAKLERGTRLIDVSADNANPTKSQTIAHTIVSEYIQSDAAQRMGVSGEANRFLLVQSDELKKRVETAEQTAQAYKDAHPNTPLDDSQAYVEGKLLELTKQVNVARQNRIRLQADDEQARKIVGKVEGMELIDQLLALQSVANDPGVLDAQKRLAEQEAGLAALAKRYLPDHPKYIQERSKLREFQAGLERAAVKAASGLGTTVAAARESESQMEKLLKQSEDAKLQTDRLSIPYASLTREVERNRALYDSVQQRLKETDITASIDANNLRIVTPASLPYKPAKPKSMLVLAACTALGLMLSFGLAFAFSTADHSLQSLAQAETELELPAVGAIPVGEDKSGSLRSAFPTLNQPHTILAESFRTLRTALDLLDEDEGAGHRQRRSFLFTSAIPGEGKSFCSVNYAVSLAQLERKTLLIDADLRLPVLNDIFFDDKKAKGLALLLEEQVELEDCFYPTEIPNLFVMPSGKRAQSPAELMANKQFPALLAKMLTHFDRVVIDSAPVHAVSDTLLMVKHVDATCLVVKAASTQVNVARAAVQKLTRANAKLAGLVLNRVPQSSSYYYYGGDYSKGVYGASPGKA